MAKSTSKVGLSSDIVALVLLVVPLFTMPLWWGTPSDLPGPVVGQQIPIVLGWLVFAWGRLARERALPSPPLVSWVAFAWAAVTLWGYFPLPAVLLRLLAPDTHGLLDLVLGTENWSFHRLALDPGRSGLLLFGLVSVGLAAWVAVGTYQAGRVRRTAVVALIFASASVMAVLGGLDMVLMNGTGPYLGIFRYYDGADPMPIRFTLYNMNHASTLLIVGACLGVGLLLQKGSTSRRLAIVVPMMFCTVGIPFALSRAGILLGAAAITLLLMIQIFRQTTKKGAAWAFSGGLLLAMAAVAGAAWLAIEPLIEAQLATLDAQALGEETRAQILRASYGFIENNFLGGTGGEGLARLFERFGPIPVDGTILWAEHLPAQLMVDHGAPTGALLTLALVAIAVGLVRRLFSSDALTRAVAMAALVMLVHDLADWGLYMPGLRAIFFVLAALALAPSPKQSHGKGSRREGEAVDDEGKPVAVMHSERAGRGSSGDRNVPEATGAEAAPAARAATDSTTAAESGAHRRRRVRVRVEHGRTRDPQTYAHGRWRFGLGLALVVAAGYGAVWGYTMHVGKVIWRLHHANEVLPHTTDGDETYEALVRKARIDYPATAAVVATASAYRFRGRIKERFRDIATVLERGLEAMPGSHELHLLYARLAMKARRPEVAARHYHWLLARAQATREGRYREVLKAGFSAVALDLIWPDDMRSRYRLVQLLLEMDRGKDVRNVLIDSGPRQTSAWDAASIERLQVLYGDPEAARRNMKALAARAPRHPGLRWVRNLLDARDSPEKRAAACRDLVKLGEQDDTAPGEALSDAVSTCLSAGDAVSARAALRRWKLRDERHDTILQYQVRLARLEGDEGQEYLYLRTIFDSELPMACPQLARAIELAKHLHKPDPFGPVYRRRKCDGPAVPAPAPAPAP